MQESNAKLMRAVSLVATSPYVRFGFTAHSAAPRPCHQGGFQVYSAQPSPSASPPRWILGLSTRVSPPGRTPATPPRRAARLRFCSQSSPLQIEFPVDLSLAFGSPKATDRNETRSAGFTYKDLPVWESLSKTCF